MTMRQVSRSARMRRLVQLLANLRTASSIIEGIRVVSIESGLAQNDIWNSLLSTAVVVGNYLWIHGGEITTWNCNSEVAAGNVVTLPSMSITGWSLIGIAQIDRQQHLLYRSIFVLD